MRTGSLFAPMRACGALNVQRSTFNAQLSKTRATVSSDFERWKLNVERWKLSRPQGHHEFSKP